MLKRKVEMKGGNPQECPKCGNDDLCIDNCEGYECMDCGCWFDVCEDGSLAFARELRPQDLD